MFCAVVAAHRTWNNLLLEEGMDLIKYIPASRHHTIFKRAEVEERMVSTTT